MKGKEKDAGDFLRKARTKGLPEKVLSYLSGFKATYPTAECLQPHELSALYNDKPLEITGRQLRERILHVKKCKFCKGIIWDLFNKKNK